MTRAYQVDVASVQPSQLYVSRAKLARVTCNLAPITVTSLPPVPVRRLGDSLIYTDGHTRALAAYLAGLSAIPVVDDEDELDIRAYAICVRWCREEGVRSIKDLEGRVIDHDQYQELWLDRCRRMHIDLGLTSSWRPALTSGRPGPPGQGCG